MIAHHETYFYSTFCNLNHMGNMKVLLIPCSQSFILHRAVLTQGPVSLHTHLFCPCKSCKHTFPLVPFLENQKYSLAQFMACSEFSSSAVHLSISIRFKENYSLEYLPTLYGVIELDNPINNLLDHLFCKSVLVKESRSYSI